MDQVEGRALNRRTLLRVVGLGGAAALVAACTPAAAPAAPTAPAARAPATTGPATTGQAAAPTGGSMAAFDALVAEAKKEGKLTISGPPAPEMRTVVANAFQQKFGIEVEYLASQGQATLNRLSSERAAGQFTMDAIIQGNTAMYLTAHPQGWLDPIKPILVHPEAADGTKWSCQSCATQNAPFMDPKGDTIMRMINFRSYGVVYNTTMVKPEEVQAYQQLLDPKWQGKMAAYDPIEPGTGPIIARFWWKSMGDEFIKKFFQDQKPELVAAGQERQLQDGVAQGKYAIVQTLGADAIEKLKQDGLPVAVAEQMDTGPSGFQGYVTGGQGLIGMMHNAPDPNAAKLFVNWLGTREGSEAFGRANKLPVPRSDVANDWVPSYVLPKPNVKYFDIFDWDDTALSRTPAELDKLKTLVGKA